MNQLPNNLPPQRIQLGEVIRKITFTIYWDLKNLLSTFHDTEPDLRTVALRKFVLISKKRLSQLLCVIRWLGQANILDLFRSLDQFNLNMNELNGLFARGLDEMYFLHNGLYSMRTMKHETRLACNLCSLGTYPLLPSSIFTGGVQVFPKEATDSMQLIDSLGLYIRSRLLFKEKLPNLPYFSISLTDGVLTIRNHFYYQLNLTLNSLSIDSRWKTLSFTFHDPVALKLQAKFSSSIWDEKKQKNLEKEILLLIQDEKNNKSIDSLLSVIEERSQLFRLRNFYLQCLKFYRHLQQHSLFQNLFEIKLIEPQKNQLELHLKFWKSVMTNE
jgi:hypothetical protein